MVAEASEGDCKGLDGFTRIDIGARDAGASALACRGKDERAEHQQADYDDGVEDDPLLEDGRLESAEFGLLHFVFARDTLDRRRIRLSPLAFGGELLAQFVVVDHGGFSIFRFSIVRFFDCFKHSILTQRHSSLRGAQSEKGEKLKILCAPLCLCASVLKTRGLKQRLETIEKSKNRKSANFFNHERRRGEGGGGDGES